MRPQPKHAVRSVSGPRRSPVGVLAHTDVLHVEDDAIIQFHFKEVVGNKVRSLLTAGDSETGLELYRSKRPDVVVTDIRLPGSNGLEMVAAIRETDRETPIIVTSAYSDAEYLLRSIELGIDKYVIKPFEPEQLLEAIDQAAQRRVSMRRVREATRFNRFLLDLNPSFIVVLEGDELSYVNRSFLEFMGYATLDEFLAAGDTVARYLKEIDGQDDPELLLNWAEYLIQAEEAVVRMQGGPGLGEGVYLATPNRFPESERHVIFLTNITRIDAQKRSLAFQAATDHLTGICNRLRFRQLLEEEAQLAKEHGRPLSVVMFDIDGFKPINDEYGHDVGDRVLVDLTRFVSANIRQYDVLARWGGEEFFILAPGCGLEQARVLAEKLRSRLEEHRFEDLRPVTCSFGVARYEPDEELDALVKRADEALYEAKRAGKNRVVAKR